MQSKEATHQEIQLGQQICERIKRIYFADKPWPLCYKEVAKKFGHFKTVMRHFYGITDMSKNVELLTKVHHFNDDDIREVIEMPVPTNQMGIAEKPGLAKYGDKVTWVPVPIDKPEVLEKVKELLGST